GDDEQVDLANRDLLAFEPVEDDHDAFGRRARPSEAALGDVEEHDAGPDDPVVHQDLTPGGAVVAHREGLARGGPDLGQYPSLPEKVHPGGEPALHVDAQVQPDLHRAAPFLRVGPVPGASRGRGGSLDELGDDVVAVDGDAAVAEGEVEVEA